MSSSAGEERGSHVVPRGFVVRRRKLRTFVTRTVLGTLLPGSGLLLSDRNKSGATVLGLFVLGVVAVCGALIYIGPAKAAVMVASRPNLMLAAGFALVVAVLIWVGTIIWTADINWPSPAGAGKKLTAFVTAFLLVGALVAPAARAMQYVLITSDLVGSVFATDQGQRRGVSPNLTGRNSWAGVPRVNVLLIGSDSEPDRPGVRTDTMMLASIDTITGDTVLFGIPRNLQNAPFPTWSPMHQRWPNGYNCGRECLLNEVWEQGVANASLYPGDPQPGLSALRESISEITGLMPDYSVVVNMASFQALVNAMGGVRINVQQRVPIGGKIENGQIVPGSIRGWIEPGVQRLDGYHAMWYSRGRVTTDDFNRMARQRCMIGALVDQVNPWMMIDRFPELAQVVDEHVYTDVPPDHLPAWAELVTTMQKGKIRSLSFSNKLVNVGNPSYEHIREMVQASLYDQPLPTPTFTDGSSTPPAFQPTPTDTPTPTSTTPSEAPTPGSPWESTPTPSDTHTPAEGLVDVAAAC